MRRFVLLLLRCRRQLLSHVVVVALDRLSVTSRPHSHLVQILNQVVARFLGQLRHEGKERFVELDQLRVLRAGHELNALLRLTRTRISHSHHLEQSDQYLVVQLDAHHHCQSPRHAQIVLVQTSRVFTFIAHDALPLLVHGEGVL